MKFKAYVRKQKALVAQATLKWEANESESVIIAQARILWDLSDMKMTKIAPMHEVSEKKHYFENSEI